MSDFKNVKHNESILPIGKYSIGDIVKFSYEHRKGDDKRISYSMIENIIPKLEELPYDSNEEYYILKIKYLTENGKFISEEDVIELIKGVR